MKAELLITGGTLVTEHGLRRADLAVSDGKIDAVLDPDERRVEADQVLEAHGLHVLPGVVDCHVHLNQPGRTEWEGFATGTAAAAAGGTTAVLDMPLNNNPPTLNVEALALKRESVSPNAYIDYGFWGGVVPENLDDLPGLYAEGVVACKAFMCHSGLDEYPGTHGEALREAMRRVASAGGLLGLHAEDHDLTATAGEKLRAEGRRDRRAWLESRPPFTEHKAVRDALRLAAETGAAIHIVHASTPEAIDLVAEARARGVDVTVETCPHYLTLDEEDLVRLGPIAKCAPPIRSRALVEALWQRVLDGKVDFIGSDHSPCPPEMKEAGENDIWQAWGGIHGIQTMLSLLLTEGVHKRRLSLPALVRLTSANPARRFGLYPAKGAIDVGSDADVALVDMEEEWKLEKEDLLTRWPISPFLDWTFRGRVKATLVRGRVVYRNGQLEGAPGFGRALRRNGGPRDVRQAA